MLDPTDSTYSLPVPMGQNKLAELHVNKAFAHVQDQMSETFSTVSAKNGSNLQQPKSSGIIKGLKGFLVCVVPQSPDLMF